MAEEPRYSACGTGLAGSITRQMACCNLEAAQERALLVCYHTNSDETARQEALRVLWESHAKLVVSIGYRCRRPNLDIADLIGAGHLGLHRAIERFDIARSDIRLATYAADWIRAAIQDFIRRNTALVRLPESDAHRRLAQAAGRLFRDAAMACQRERVAATEAELCTRVGKRIGLPGDEVAASMRLLRGGVLSLDSAPEGEDTPWDRLGDRLACPNAGPEETVIARLDQAKLRQRIAALSQDILTEREREVLAARCPGEGAEIAHAEALAARFGVTRERICQLEASAKRKLQVALAAEGLAERGAAPPLPGMRARRRVAA